MDLKSLIEKYSRFDTPDIAERIAREINNYIEYEGIEYLPAREIHGRHTGALSISSGGFRSEYDFLWPVLYLCRVDRDGVVSADLRKIEKHLDLWRVSLHETPEEDLAYWGDQDFEEDDDLNAFRSAAYKAELDGFMNLDSPSVEEIIAHEEAVEEIWNLSSAGSMKIPAVEGIEVSAIPEEGNESSGISDGSEDIPASGCQREYDADGFPIYTDEEIEIYQQAVDDMVTKQHLFLNKCRDIFYTKGKAALNEYLNEVEEYSSKLDCIEHFDDPMCHASYDIREIRERFEVWDEEKERLEREKMWDEMQKSVDDYWNDPAGEKSGEWVSPTLVEDLKDYFEEQDAEPSFAEFVSAIRRGEFGLLPEDYDGLARPGEPGYYGE